jgi:YgiT-type zinc finger domain-containing protein
MSQPFQIKTCPTCGSSRIRRVVRDVTRQYKGQTFIVPAVELYDCPVCDEKAYDREAMLKIEAYSPAYRKAKTLVGA